MNRNRFGKMAILAVTFLGLAGAVAYAAGAWTIVGYQLAGNTITVNVHNVATHTVSGTVNVTVVRNEQTLTGVSSLISIGANGTVAVPIVVGTITDDITPFDSITFGTSTEDTGPF
jgi:hypothetical protein